MKKTGHNLSVTKEPLLQLKDQSISDLGEHPVQLLHFPKEKSEA